ncbi:hypothetical protein [Rubinisphaera brasiliensis]|uniref:Uncharacterized protein n=1 Tax=Rubinisphaera brasiliensis (strain ATCC 49424 / DSM 5305 / JCM 21570 / IAM 15109 / NBRC 103401 / IFAM 1448) TaxID=756272 RepID=F0SNK6_RUBBR|nr:hypothetical protein [Rubinisphaera brasiliensis]ADY57840.1 hypothetical protein Plabr_0211 [Rubinisphaera brasiliensis DSM 5305]
MDYQLIGLIMVLIAYLCQTVGRFADWRAIQRSRERLVKTRALLLDANSTLSTVQGQNVNLRREIEAMKATAGDLDASEEAEHRAEIDRYEQHIAAQNATIKQLQGS